MIGKILGGFVLFIIFSGLAFGISLFAIAANRAIKENKDE